jgi:hypothetical protein
MRGIKHRGTSPISTQISSGAHGSVVQMRSNESRMSAQRQQSSSGAFRSHFRPAIWARPGTAEVAIRKRSAASGRAIGAARAVCHRRDARVTGSS